MTTITLGRVWHLGSQLGRGGFGRVYLARSDDDVEAVVKLIPKAPGAQRELLFENVGDIPNVIPVIDKGEHKNYWALVMPRAEKSLRQHLADSGGALAIDEVVPVLIDVATALAGLEAEVTHRDVKPDNVLLCQGNWCLADFGIARYAEATTASDTRKFLMTAAYAVPERWRNERATHASDVYSFGVMAYELLAGQRPFPGPDRHDYMEQHLHRVAPPVPNCPVPLAGLIAECLYKVAATRPPAARIVARLHNVAQPASPAVEQLQQANKLAVEAQARRDVGICGIIQGGAARGVVTGCQAEL